jgi:O-antigen ligase
VRGFVGTLHRVPATGAILAATGVLAVSVAFGHGAQSVAPLILMAAIFVGWHHVLLRWQTLVGLIIAVVLFVPIGFYRLPANLPFNLDLYRLLVAVVALLWISSLLVDRRITLRSTAFDRPLLLVVGCVFASELVNQGRVDLYGSNVVKSLTFFLGFVFVYYIVTSTIRHRAAIDGLLKLLVVGGGFIGAAAVIERQSRYNVFYHLHWVLPFLNFEGASGYLQLGGRVRAYGSAQQPIALGAALVLLVPVSIYLTRRYGRRWMLATVLLVLGALASGSRTAITMAVAEVVVFLILKPKETRRLWPLVIPGAVVVHVFLPGAIGSLKNSFFPKGGIIQQQSYLGNNYDAQLSGGRIRQLGPMLSEANRHWPFGEGYGTRITGFDVKNRNAPILDNQWLENALDVGFVGVALWVWLILGAVRRLMRASRRGTKDHDDWLFAGLAAGIAAFGIGMLTFDAFAFTQAVFLFWVLLALSAAALAAGSSTESPSAPARRARRVPRAAI